MAIREALAALTPRIPVALALLVHAALTYLVGTRPTLKVMVSISDKFKAEIGCLLLSRIFISLVSDAVIP